MAGFLDNFRWPECECIDWSERRNAVASVVAGILVREMAQLVMTYVLPFALRIKTFPLWTMNIPLWLLISLFCGNSRVLDIVTNNPWPIPVARNPWHFPCWCQTLKISPGSEFDVSSQVVRKLHESWCARHGPVVPISSSTALPVDTLPVASHSW